MIHGGASTRLLTIASWSHRATVSHQNTSSKNRSATRTTSHSEHASGSMPGLELDSDSVERRFREKILKSRENILKLVCPHLVKRPLWMAEKTAASPEATGATECMNRWIKQKKGVEPNAGVLWCVVAIMVCWCVVAMMVCWCVMVMMV